MDVKENKLDQATARRLARLRTMPVDTSGLEAALRKQIPLPTAKRTRPIWWRPVQAIAATLLLAVTIIGILIATSGGPALASSDMVKMHEDIVANRIAIRPVESVAQASEVLASTVDDGSPMPEHAACCCMRTIKNKKVACVLLRSESAPITLTVASAADVRPPKAPRRVCDGVTYYVQPAGKLHMVMTERDGRWICLIGELSPERLISVAAQLKL